MLAARAVVQIGALSIVTAGMIAPTLCQPSRWPPRRALSRLWLAHRVFLFGCGVFLVIIGVGNIVRTSKQAEPLPDHANFLPAGVITMICAAIATKANRGRVTRWLGRLGQSGDAQN